MTSLHDLDTPAVVVLLDRLEDNIARVQGMVVRARPRQPPAHQDPQDPGDRQDADGGRRGRPHLPEARRGGGLHRRRRLRRYPPHLQHHRRAEDRPADGAGRRASSGWPWSPTTRPWSAACPRRACATAATCACSSNATPASGATACSRRRRRSSSPASPLKLPRIAFEGLMVFPNTAPSTAEFFTPRHRAVRQGRHSPAGRSRAAARRRSTTLADFPMMTEHRAGTYVYNDVMMVHSGVADLGRSAPCMSGPPWSAARPPTAPSSMRARRC